MGVTPDSTFLIDLMADDPGALAKDEELDDRGATRLLTAPVLYEVTVGPLFLGSRTRLATARSVASRFQVLPLDEPAALRAAEVQAELLRAGRPMGGIDALIAGIASVGGHTLITRDGRFDDAADLVGLDIESY